MKFYFFLLFFFFFGFFANAQKTSKEFRSKKFVLVKDSIQIDSVSINPQKFKVLDKQLQRIASTEYSIDFSNALLIINPKKYTEITVEYFLYPTFITKTYTPYSKSLIVPNTNNTKKLYSLTSNKKTSEVQLFEGLQTKGFIVRGITSGNNQNVVTNSALDLEISGKLSKNVTLRANIYDTNIPLQENGYSQNITDFDRIFIELESEKWRVKAGDVSLENDDSYFMSFSKQVSGLEVEAKINKNTIITGSGALVRGKFSTFNFVGIESNQGPYKIFGSNNQPGIIIIAGSEEVFVNGVPLQRGEGKDYTIDYNLAEVRFNTTYPITNDMRIAVEFQISDRNYTRFITYEKAAYKTDKFSLTGYFYSESDAKNSPLQQNLTDNQKQILANAGNNTAAMFAQSAFIDTFSENKILYKKTTIGALETFEYSVDENLELYTVRFTNIGANQGDYILEKTIATGTIFKYVGANLGDYNPIIRLAAPTKSQIFIINSDYNPSEKTAISAEVAISNNDLNLFSAIDNNQNKGVATKLHWKQVLVDKKWQFKTVFDYELVTQNFSTERPFESLEFKRDWNLTTFSGTKNLLETAFTLQRGKGTYFSYGFNRLQYAVGFTGNKHQLTSKIVSKNTYFSLDGSLLSNTSTLEDNSFVRLTSKVEHSFSKSWLGGLFLTENNQKKEKITEQFINTSHRFKEFETYIGFGDSTNVFTKIGVSFRTNDSIKTNRFTQINQRKTVYINSKIIQNKTSNLSIYANYRLTKNAFAADEKSLNSKIVYNQQLFSNFIRLGTSYETSSGNVARQDYVYIKTEPGQGFYTWIDYNNDNVKDIDEFEIAQYQDQATYLRVPLPNLRYVPTQRAKWKQSFTINPKVWINKSGFKKAISHFYNQSFLSAENEQHRVGNSFHLNPFNFEKRNLVSLHYSFRNSLYFNKGLQKYSLIYLYGNSRNKQQYFIGNQENTTAIHQLTFQHKLTTFWLLDIVGNVASNRLETENFNNRNYNIDSKEIEPKISYVFNKNHRFSAFYTFKNKENTLLNFEKLQQQKIGFDYLYRTKKKGQISATLNLIDNNFTGNTNSPVAYQLLEGLQVGKNYTWSFLFNKKLNSFLHLNLNYVGRKSKTSKTIHTGSVQLKAIF